MLPREQFRLIYTYYDNPSMLERQIDNWNQYPCELRDRIGIVLVDDGSPKHPARPLMRRCEIAHAVYRVDVDVPWHMHAARNIGAKEAGTDDVWMFCTDMDTLLPPESALQLATRQLDPCKFYSFERKFVPPMNFRKTHHNTYLVRRSVYWRVGGYDEDYVGMYHSEGPFMRQLAAIAPNEHLDDVITINYMSMAVSDANTRTLSRNEDEYRRLFEKKCLEGNERACNPFRNSWTRQA